MYNLKKIQKSVLMIEYFPYHQLHPQHKIMWKIIMIEIYRKLMDFNNQNLKEQIKKVKNIMKVAKEEIPLPKMIWNLVCKKNIMILVTLNKMKVNKLNVKYY
mmetsp:Transcript_4983/g.443  ORF Transcript_4983/g.443 Transcript_4983/m.443 type:complete len:102 (+) Transcript_4983:288-593(+)